MLGNRRRRRISPGKNFLHGSQHFIQRSRKSSVNTSQFYSSRSLTTKHEFPCDRSVLSYNDIGHRALLLRGAPFIFRGHRRGNFSGDVPFFAKQSFSRARLLFPPLLCAAHRQPRTSLSAIASCSPFEDIGRRVSPWSRPSLRGPSSGDRAEYHYRSFAKQIF